jgi:hypothetical protein
MKNRLLYFLTPLALFLALPGLMMAQSQEQIDKFNQERKVYFTEKLELTDSEAKAFWPLYDDFQNRKMKLVEDERNTWSYAQKNADHLSEKEILETLEKAYTLKEKQLALEIEYYQNKFLKALPAKKVLQLGKVEWDFRRHLIEKLRGNDGGRKGQGGGSGNRPEAMEPFSHGPAPALEQAPMHRLSPSCQ